MVKQSNSQVIPLRTGENPFDLSVVLNQNQTSPIILKTWNSADVSNLCITYSLIGLPVEQLTSKLLSFGWVLEHAREILGRSALKEARCRS